VSSGGGGESRRSTRRIRWVARSLSLFVAAIWVVMGIVPALIESPAWTSEDKMMAGLISGSLLSILIAWRYEAIGGALLVLCGVAHSTFAYFAAGHNIPLAMAISGGPFFVLGVLFLLARRRPAE